MINYHKILGFYGETNNTDAICETEDNGLLVFATKEALLEYINSKPNLRTLKVSPRKLSFQKAIAALKSNNKITFELEAYKRFNAISKENDIHLPEPSTEELKLLQESKWPLVLVDNSNAILQAAQADHLPRHRVPVWLESPGTGERMPRPGLWRK